MEITLTNANFNEEVINSDKPVLVDFWATWCGPCMMIAPIVEEIAQEFAGKIKVGKVNVDEEDELASEYEIYSIPTLLLFKNGEVVGQLIGYNTKEELIRFINEN
ncbi:MAG: thioredoxin [Clostridia bacterium]|nr:thioredoxin [Clostridia bacterium]